MCTDDSTLSQTREFFPWLVDYSDIVDLPIPADIDIEANMGYYLVKSGRTHIKDHNKMWELDVDSQTTGLYRQNAMTYYEDLTPYLVLARNVENHHHLFYLAKCKNHPTGWVQIDLDTGENIYNIHK